MSPAILINSLQLLFPSYVLKLKLSLFFIKNVSSSTSHKKTPSLHLYLCLYVREFKKILPNTFIYESILIKIYMNTNIINTQIFYLEKNDLK